MSNEDKTRARIHQRYGDIAEAPPPDGVQRAIDGIVELLAGKPNDLAGVVLDLDGVPEFNRGVYDIARTIPPGKTLTYGESQNGSAASSCRAMSARRSGEIPVRSWCPVTACSPPAASPADFPPMAASRQNSKCWRSKARRSITPRICSIESRLLLPLLPPFAGERVGVRWLYPQILKVEECAVSPPHPDRSGRDASSSPRRSDLSPQGGEVKATRALTRNRVAGKSVATAPDCPYRRRREMRGAAQRVGVAVALQEVAARRGRLRLVDVEFRR